MNTLVHADVFFFITAIAVVVLSVVALIVLVNVWYFVRDARRIMETVRKGADVLSKDLLDLRSEVKQSGQTMKSFFSTIARIFTPAAKPKKRTTKSS